MNQHYDDFRKKLQEIFMMDHAELDFGIYRIMNHKRKQINDFLDNQLLPQVEKTIQEYVKADDTLQQELAKAIEGCKNLGIDPDTNPKVQELKKQISQGSTSVDDLQNTVFSRLTQFFSRYYEEGDFVSQRRYKTGSSAYSIPYNGEEVKLYWANYDQYYIKTSEYFKNYTFKLQDGRKVCFVLVDASTEQNNNKNTNGLERRFDIFRDEEGNPVIEEVDGELHINFTYELMPKATKQKDLNGMAFEQLSAAIPSVWNGLLMKGQVTDSSVLLEKHINAYTAKNSFDYFIHKDLGGFLNRELDFYIKNEVFVIADLDAAKLQSQLAVVKAIETVGKKIIDFLAQLENFQKRLWLKKKFVVQSDYCITLDRVPKKFYQEICENDMQRTEWVKLFAIDEIKGDGMFTKGYCEPLTIEFLEQNPFLVLDTKFFPLSFKHKLIAEMENLDEQTNGLLIRSENFQALQLLKKKYANAAKCVYIDPPYNTGDDDFAYKDNLKESSWLTLIHNRLEQTTPYYKAGGTFAASIDINEVDHLTELLDLQIGKEERKANITVRRASLTGAKVINPGPVNISENVVFYNNGKTKWEPKNAYREKGYDNRYGSFIINPEDNYEKWQFSTVLDEFAKSKGIAKSKLKKELGDRYTDELLNFVIKNANSVVQFATLDENSVGSTAVEMKHLSMQSPEKIFHIKREDANDYYIVKGKVILFYKDRLKWMGDGLVPVEQISDIWDDVLPNDLHNEGGVELKKGKKPEKLINRIFEVSTNEGDMILDYFAGSATSGAVALKSKRRFINIEANEYFEDIPLRRLKNTLYGDKSGISNLYQWKGGGCFKYQRLEQYEDTLNNLHVDDGFGQNNNESYMLRYMLDTETRESLLGIKDFVRPFDYTIKTTRDNELLDTPVDLVETFNYLIGLHVGSIHWHKDDNICVVEGKSHVEGDDVLVIWRNQDVIKNDDLNEFFRKQGYSTLDREFDIIYVNGDNTLPNLKSDEEHWKVRLIEQEMMKRMFEED